MYHTSQTKLSYFRYIVSLFVSIAFIVVGGFGFMSFTHHHHDAGCPFMPGEKTECMMSIVDHVVAWQHMFVSVFVDILSLLFICCCISLILFFTYPDLFVRKKPRGTIETLSTYNLFLELFSDGILNSKAH